LGIPGKGTWQSKWKEYIEGLNVYLWQEPDAEDLPLRVLPDCPELNVITAPDGIKDISEAHIQGLDIPSWIAGLPVEQAKAIKSCNDTQRLKDTYSEAKDIIESNAPLTLIREEIEALGYGGDLKPAMITYLAMTSRLLAMREGAMPVHLLLKGPSSSGKSYTMGIIRKTLPEEAYVSIDAGSPRAIIYDKASLEHKALLFCEADSLPAGEDNPAASAVRNLLQDHNLHYKLTTRDENTGQFEVTDINKSGPTVLITTSTKSLGAQLMTRLFTLEIADNKEQIVASLATQAKIEVEGVKPPSSALKAFQLYLQLRAPIEVDVPFAKELAKAIGRIASASRVNRDFARLVSLIKTVAVIRHHKRQVKNGHIVAELQDYETVRELVNDMYVDTSSGATKEIRALVEAVKEMTGEKITTTAIAKHMGIWTEQASRHAKRAIKLSWLVNREIKKGYPGDYTVGEPMPKTDGLPTLTELITPITTDNTPLSENLASKTEHITGKHPSPEGTHPPPLVGETMSVEETEQVLGMSIKDAVSIWEKEGKPLTHLASGINCTDLSAWLALHRKRGQVEMVREWLDSKGGH